jgi:hypothetical protein
MKDRILRSVLGDLAAKHHIKLSGVQVNERTQRFRGKIKQALADAHKGADGKPGLVVFGDEQTIRFLKRAPAQLVEAVIDEATMGPRQPLAEIPVLVTRTRAIRDRMFLSLEPSGRMIVAALREMDQEAFKAVNARATETGTVVLEVRIEWEGTTACNFAKLAALPPEQAGRALEAAFWTEINPRIRNPFVRIWAKEWKNHEDLQPSDIRMKRGTHAGMRDAMGWAIAVAHTCGMIDLPVGKALDQLSDEDLGYVNIGTAVPGRKPTQFNNGVLGGCYPLKHFAQLLISKMRPAAAGIGRISDCAGNRMESLNWYGHHTTVRYSSILAESAHFHLAAEGDLRDWLKSDLGMSKTDIADIMVEITGSWKNDQKSA